MSLISEAELNEINQMDGEVAGYGPIHDRRFLLEKKGKEGLERVEKEMEKFGYPLKLEEVKRGYYYPVQIDPLFMLLSQKIFGWDEKMMEEWGRWSAKSNIFTQMVMKYFISPERTAREAGRYWKKYYTKGELALEKFNKKERCLILVLKDFKLPSVYWRYLEGFFYQIASYVLPKKNLKVEGSENRTNNTSQFKISW